MYGTQKAENYVPQCPSSLSSSADLEEEDQGERQRPGQARSLNLGQNLSLMLNPQMNPAKPLHPRGGLVLFLSAQEAEPARAWSSGSCWPRDDFPTGTSLMHHSRLRRRVSPERRWLGQLCLTLGSERGLSPSAIPPSSRSKARKLPNHSQQHNLRGVLPPSPLHSHHSARRPLLPLSYQWWLIHATATRSRFGCNLPPNAFAVWGRCLAWSREQIHHAAVAGGAGSQV